jgi:hypothetical protein
MSDKQMAESRQNLQNLKILIVDEMSLLDSDMLTNIHLRLCKIFQTSSEVLFGGIAVILVGDLLQLPPVQGSYIFQPPNNKRFQAFHNAIDLWQSFEPLILQHNHRQGEGNAWATTLNRFRVGQVIPEDIELLESRRSSKTFLEEECMHVFYTNLEVKNHNDQMLEKLPQPKITIKAIKTLPKGYQSGVLLELHNTWILWKSRLVLDVCYSLTLD